MSRVLTLTTLAFVTIASVCVGHAAKTLTATVPDFRERPRDYLDRRIEVTGELSNGIGGPYLCSLPSQTAGRSRECVALDDEILPFSSRDRTLVGSIVRVVGYFANDCLPAKRVDTQGNVTEVICVDRGASGFLIPEEARIIGIARPCLHSSCGEAENDSTVKVDLDSPDAVSVKALAVQIVAAIRSKDNRALLNLMWPSLRTESEWYLEDPASYLSRKYFPPSLMSMDAKSLIPDKHYRLYRSKLSFMEEEVSLLCFCPGGNCEGAWEHEALFRSGRPNHSVHCLEIWKWPQGWFLL